MKVNFNELEEYLLKYGYPKNELMKEKTFEIPEMTSYEYTMNNIKNFSNVKAMTFYGKTIRYSDFANAIDDIANGLKAIGTNKGDVVATLMPNIPETAYVQYGASKIGAIVSNIDPRTPASQLLDFIKKEKIKQIVVVDVMYNSAIKPIERQLKEEYNIKNIVVVPATNSVPTLLKSAISLSSKIKGTKLLSSDFVNVIYYDELINNSRFENANNVGYEPGKVALYQHSSGTSQGVPKSIPLTNENINSFVEKHRPTVFSSLEPGTTLLHLLPYFAAYGCINSAHLGFNYGLTLQQIPEFKFQDFGYLAYKNKSEILIGVPNWFSMITKDKRINNKSFDFLKMAISGGDSCSVLDKKQIDEFLMSHGAHCVMTNGHGMSELCGSGSYQFPGHENGLGIGTPFPYDKYIVVKDGKVVPLTKDGIEGEIYIYSPSATSGNFNGEQFAQVIDINGFPFLNSKDTMRINSNYEMEFIGRSDRTFTRFDGHKIVPKDVENKFYNSHNIKDCMVVPYEDDYYMGKMPIAYVVASRSLTDDEKYNTILSVVNDILASSDVTSREIPRKVKFLDSLPQNKSSKNDYLALEMRELDGSEYTININETNLNIGNVEVLEPHKKAKVLKKIK